MNDSRPSPRSLPIARHSEAETRYGRDLNTALNRTAGCTACALYRERTCVVPGAGDPDAIVAFIGEAPGREEDLTGSPFVGRAGELLDKMIVAMEIELRKIDPSSMFSREHGAFIANVCQCRPPMNRKPERAEVEACLPNLWAIFAALPRVRIVVALGGTPLCAVKGDPLAKITRERGRWFERCLPNSDRVLRVMPTFHPSYLLRSPWEKSKAWLDLLEVGREIGRIA